MRVVENNRSPKHLISSKNSSVQPRSLSASGGIWSSKHGLLLGNAQIVPDGAFILTVDLLFIYFLIFTTFVNITLST